MNVSPRIKRPFVFLLVGCGWLSVLGNSPGETYHQVPVGPSSGPVVIRLGDVRGWEFSAPVRRTTLRKKGGAVIEEVTCVDGSDCLPWLYSPGGNGCFSMEPDTRPPSPKDAPNDRSGDGNRDTTDDVSGDATGDATGDGAGDGPGDSGRDSVSDGLLAADAPATPAQGKTTAGEGKRWSCRLNPGGPLIQLISRSETDRSFPSTGDLYEIVVETAAGTRSTLEYTIEAEQPGGYFGC